MTRPKKARKPKNLERTHGKTPLMVFLEGEQTYIDEILGNDLGLTKYERGFLKGAGLTIGWVLREFWSERHTDGTKQSVLTGPVPWLNEKRRQAALRTGQRTFVSLAGNEFSTNYGLGSTDARTSPQENNGVHGQPGEDTPVVPRDNPILPGEDSQDRPSNPGSEREEEAFGGGLLSRQVA